MLRFLNVERRLWIDALCIAQHDDMEKNYQIPLMGKIYESAARVIAWLGEANALTGMAFEAMHEMPILYRISSAELLDRLVAISEERSSEQDSLEWALSQRNIWDEINNLYRRPYWSRLWVFQELVLARKVLFQCGHWTISAESLVAFSAQLNDLIHGQSSLRFSSGRQDEILTTLHGIKRSAADEINMFANDFRNSRAPWFTTLKQIPPQVST